VSESESLQLNVADEKTCLVPFILSLGLAFILPLSHLGLAISSSPLHSVCNDSDFFLSGPLGKHAAPEPAEGVFDRLKRAKIVTTAPSTTGKLAIYEHLQYQPSEKILDDRPEPDADIPPIPLLYHGFGHFLDIMDARDDVPGLADVEVLELRKEDDLASKMTGYFENENDRRDAALPCLNRIFDARSRIKIPLLSPTAIGSVVTNGHNTATHSVGTMTVEFKNWSTGISALPQIELVCYVARLNAVEMNDEARRQLYLGWRVPCVGLTIIG
jgi:hypothetical protein